jgi:hypothetical protein
MRILLVTPPMLQFNTAYPAVPTLAAFLRDKGHDVAQEDLSLALALRLFCASGVAAVEKILRKKSSRQQPEAVRHFLQHAEKIRAVVDDAVHFLQGRAPDLEDRLCRRGSLPEGSRFKAMRGLIGGQARDVVARHRASLFLDEIADAVREGVDDRFELARYAEHLAADASGFDDLAQALTRRPTLLDRWIDELAGQSFARHTPTLVGFTVPFPGTLYGAFRIARRIRALAPTVVTVLGGGYVNTELRDLAESRVFDIFDYVCFDDGEIPLLRIVEAQGVPSTALVRTRLRRDGQVIFCDDPAGPRLKHRDRPAPDFSPMRNAGYIAMAESPNPMHRLWSDRPWLKLTLAHGCYWHRCAFCDTSLDYIRSYDPTDAETIVGWMERAMADTGLRGFHFVDEAAPPALLARLSKAILDRGLTVDWWANIRFERRFDDELARLMKRSGCIAVSGGLECAHDRLLALMDKGITNAQASEAMRALAGSGILVHAYLMYGYPTQTVEETLEALDFVRGLFADGRVHSAYWHRFALTAHSPVFQDLTKLRLRVLDPREGTFTRNEIPFDEPGRPDLGMLGEGLRRAVYNFMHGAGFDLDVREWFDFPVPGANHRRNRRKTRRQNQTPVL